MNEDQPVEPSSRLDYYSKQDICSFIAEKSFPTFSKWETEGKVFLPRHYKQSSDTSASRQYYSLADAMRLSIMLYGSIKMSLIYNLLIHKHYEEGSGIESILNTNSVVTEIVRADIKNALDIVKYEINNKIENPINLNLYIRKENANGH